MGSAKSGNKNAIPPKGHQFQPGVSGNPAGRSAKALTQMKVSVLMGELCHMTPDELKQVISDPQSNVFKITVAVGLLKATETGDYSRLEFLLQRSIGKVQEKMEISQPVPFIVKRLNGEVIEMGVKPLELPEPDET